MLESRRFATFVQRVVEKLDTPQIPNDLSPQERVDQAYRMSRHLFNSEDELTDENAVKAAAIIAALDRVCEACETAAYGESKGGADR
jgi:hypothetical protein